jgi:hypothetical protein
MDLISKESSYIPLLVDREEECSKLSDSKRFDGKDTDAHTLDNEHHSNWHHNLFGEHFGENITHKISDMSHKGKL